MRPSLSLAIALVACGDDEVDMRDAGGDATAAVAPSRVVEPEAPRAPALPDMGRCPEGWGERMLGEVRICDPFPAGIPTCEGASILLPGSSACEPLGSTCPPDGMRTDIPDRIESEASLTVAYFVRSGATGGDGTRARPFGTIAEALAVPTEEGESIRSIVLSRGVFREPIEITGPLDRLPSEANNLAIVGACTSDTLLEAGDARRPAIALSGGVRLVLTDVTVSNPLGPVISVSHGAALNGNQLVVGPAVDGITITGSDLNLAQTVVRDISSQAIIARPGARCGLTDVALERTHRALQATGARLELARIAFLGPGYTGIGGIRSVGYGSEIAIVDVGGAIGIESFLLTIDRAYIAHGRDGAVAVSDDWLELTHTTIEDGGASPLLVTNGGAVLRDVVVQGTPAPLIAGDTNVAIAADLGADLEIERVAVFDTAGSGFSASGAARVHGRDLVVAGAALEGEGVCLIGSESEVALARVRLERCATGGALISDSRVELTDLSIVDVGEDNARPTLGLGIFRGAEVRIQRAAIERARLLGISAHGAGTTLEGSDLHVAGVLPMGASSDFGRGIEIASRAVGRLVRTRVEDVHDHGVLAVDRGELTMSDVTIADVAPRACTTPECQAHPAGIGLAAYGASAIVDHFVLERASLCGAHRAADATLQLADGTIAENAVGLCVAGDATIDDISRDVSYRDNGTNLNARELPVPEAVPPVELQ